MRLQTAFFDELTLGNNTSDDKTTATSPILKPINPEATMGLVPTGTRNVIAKSLILPDGIVECCRFVTKQQKIDVIAELIITATEAPATSA